ncbi:MAG: stage III sporulation protein AA [Eubacteriaceae bacterium]|nr:stage III sporulation protein AA [Eubacteriaceae bacterium]
MIPNSVLGLFPQNAQNALLALPGANSAEEIRIRAGRPIEVCFGNSPVALDLIAGQEMVLAVVSNAAKKSLYAHEEQLKNGFLTIEGGHRVGFCGRVHRSGESISLIDNFSSANIRIAREIKGSASQVLPYVREGARVLSALIVSAPGVGKTTVLRDLARVISDAGMKVGIIDERCEIACCVDGTPTLDVGKRSDVLDNCPKAAGVMLLARSMSPQVIITDEIGGQLDYEALLSAAACGISVLASAHASSISELLSKAYLKPIIDSRLFDRYIFIKRTASGIGPSEAYNAEMERI